MIYIKCSPAHVNCTPIDYHAPGTALLSLFEHPRPGEECEEVGVRHGESEALDVHFRV